MTVNVKTALKFLDKIKDAYGADSQEYRDFLDVLRDLRSGRADIRETHRRVIAIFQGRQELIEGYAVFIPPRNTIDILADPQGNILVTMPTGTMEIARDGTVVNETHTQAPETLDEEAKSPELSEQEKRLLEKLRTQIADSEKQEEYEALVASFEAKLRISPEQRKVSPNVDQSREFAEKLQGLLGDNDELKKALSDALQ